MVTRVSAPLCFQGRKNKSRAGVHVCVHVGAVARGAARGVVRIIFSLPPTLDVLLLGHRRPRGLASHRLQREPPLAELEQQQLLNPLMKEKNDLDTSGPQLFWKMTRNPE